MVLLEVQEVHRVTDLAVAHLLMQSKLEAGEGAQANQEAMVLKA
jgi:hypothetical protein